MEKKPSPAVNHSNSIIIVSGLPRSGTSMLMKMLEAGGIQVLVDHIRMADDDNPKGYYEFEAVKTLPDGNYTWMPDARGKVVKVIAALLPYLPDSYSYRIIFMQRELSEILASQLKMLSNRGKDQESVKTEMMYKIYEKHLKQVSTWMDEHANVQSIEINYNQLLREPAPQIELINEFLGGTLNTESMYQVVDPDLYRQRKKPA